MQGNYTVCHCKQVSYADIANALDNNKNFDSVLEAFDDVLKVTHCSTGCGGCHQKMLDLISEIMMGNELNTFMGSRLQSAPFFFCADVFAKSYIIC